MNSRWGPGNVPTILPTSPITSGTSTSQKHVSGTERAANPMHVDYTLITKFELCLGMLLASVLALDCTYILSRCHQHLQNSRCRRSRKAPKGFHWVSHSPKYQAGTKDGNFQLSSISPPPLRTIPILTARTVHVKGRISISDKMSPLQPSWPQSPQLDNYGAIAHYLHELEGISGLRRCQTEPKNDPIPPPTPSLTRLPWDANDF